MSSLLDVRNLEVGFQTQTDLIKAVNNISFSIEAGQTLALVGESGSGKSTAALALQRLISARSVRTAGEVLLEGKDLMQLDDAGLQQIRGARIGMIFQDPSMALNPVYTIGDQVIEPLQLHQRLGRRDALARAQELLRQVHVSDPEARLSQYPHNLSGGMRQRIMIAMALACRPSLLIADEPTTALDVTVQAQVLRLIDDMKQAMNMAVLLITHDLGVVWETADRVAVMYCGRIVEEGPVEAVLSRPTHPYTRGLLRAANWEGAPGSPLFEIPGSVPSPRRLPVGCAFGPRCASFSPACALAVPPFVSVAPQQRAACFLPVTRS